MTVASYVVSNLTSLRAVDMTNAKISYNGFSIICASNTSQYLWNSSLSPAGENWGDVIIIPSSRPGGLGAFVKASRTYSSASTPAASPPLDGMWHFNTALLAMSHSNGGNWYSQTWT